MSGARWVGVIAVVGLLAGGGLLMTRQTSSRVVPARNSAVANSRQALFDEIQPVHLTNCDLKRFGEQHDGGSLHVRVHQYDCFDLREPSCPGGDTVFHGECVGTAAATEDGRPFDTLAHQFAKNGDASKPIVMKIDVEGAEWDSFLFAPDSVFNGIDQLVVEFHHVEDPKYVAVMRRLKDFFYVAHVHYNNFSCDPALKPFPSWAFEVLFVNKRLGMTDGAAAAAGPGALDTPNNANAPDCQASERGTS